MKQEVPEASFVPQAAPPPQPAPVAEDLVNDFPPVLTKSETGFYTPLGVTTPSLEKVKRGNPRKPAAPKAKKVKAEPALPPTDPASAAAAVAASAANNGASQSQIPDHMPVQKKKRDRFKGIRLCLCLCLHDVGFCGIICISIVLFDDIMLQTPHSWF